MCNTRKILCYWTNTTGMMHLKKSQGRLITAEWGMHENRNTKQGILIEHCGYVSENHNVECKYSGVQPLKIPWAASKNSAIASVSHIHQVFGKKYLSLLKWSIVIRRSVEWRVRVYKETKYSKESGVDTDSEWTWCIELHRTMFFDSS